MNLSYSLLSYEVSNTDSLATQVQRLATPTTMQNSVDNKMLDKVADASVTACCWTGSEGGVSLDVGGMSTASMMCTTPFVAALSAAVTLALPLMVTPAPDFATVKSCPSSVFTFCVACRSLL